MMFPEDLILYFRYFFDDHLPLQIICIVESLEFGGIVVEVWVRGHREQLRQLPLSRGQTLSVNRETWSATRVHLVEGFESTRRIITYSA